jgi:hypothetical protein
MAQPTPIKDSPVPVQPTKAGENAAKSSKAKARGSDEGVRLSTSDSPFHSFLGEVQGRNEASDKQALNMFNRISDAKSNQVQKTFDQFAIKDPSKAVSPEQFIITKPPEGLENSQFIKNQIGAFNQSQVENSERSIFNVQRVSPEQALPEGLRAQVGINSQGEAIEQFNLPEEGGRKSFFVQSKGAQAANQLKNSYGVNQSMNGLGMEGEVDVSGQAQVANMNNKKAQVANMNNEKVQVANMNNEKAQVANMNNEKAQVANMNNEKAQVANMNNKKVQVANMNNKKSQNLNQQKAFQVFEEKGLFQTGPQSDIQVQSNKLANASKQNMLQSYEGNKDQVEDLIKSPNSAGLQMANGESKKNKSQANESFVNNMDEVLEMQNHGAKENQSLFQTKHDMNNAKIAPKHLEFSNLNTSDTNSIINKISTYIEQNNFQNTEKVDLLVNHHELGQFKVKVSKQAVGDKLDIQIDTISDKGHHFFKENQTNLNKTLFDGGVKFANIKLVQATPTEFSKGNFEHNQSQEQSFGKNQNSGQSSSQRHGEDRDSQRRRESWEDYQERKSA